MRERFYRWLYEWVQPRYVEHCLTDEEQDLLRIIESSDGLTFHEYEVVFDAAEEVEAFIQSQEETKH